MADEAIIQTVVLQGQDDIKAGFAAIERAGEQMFKSLEAASGASPFQKFALGISGTVAAVVAITGALFKWSESAAAATTAMGNLADASGTTIENLSTLSAALNVSTEKFGAGLTRMATRIESEWKDIQKSQKDAANLIIEDTLGIQNAYLSLERATLSLANADKTAANLQISNANSIKGAKLSLTEAIERQRIAEGGAVDPQFNEQINREKAALAVKQARLALAEAQKKADEDAAIAQNKLSQSANDAETSILNLSKAQEKATEDSKNSVANLKQFVENLSKGVTDASLKVNVNAENVIKGLVAAVGPGVTALKDLQGTFTDVASAPPALNDVLLKLADVFHNTDDAVLKLSISTAIFGRALGQKMVEELSPGKKALLEIQDRLKSIGLVLTKDDQDTAKAFTKSIDTLGNTLSILSTKFGLAFSPSFTALIKEINAAIEGSSESFKAFGQVISDKVTPIVVAFFETITGKNLQGNLKLNSDQLIDLEQWKATFEAVKGVVVGAFSLIAGAAKLLASVLNGIFGKDTFSGMDVAIGALLLKFGGLLGIIITVGVALNKLSGGTLFESLSINIDGVSKHFANLKKFIESPFSTDAWDRFWEERTKIIDDVAKQQADIFKRAEERKNQSLTDQAKKPIDEGLAVATQAGKDFKDTLDKAAPSATTVADKVGGIADAADKSRAKVKDLASEIVLLDANKGTNQDSAGGTIKFQGDGPGRGKVVKNPFLEEGPRDASKSFGQINIDARNAADAIDEMENAISQLADAFGPVEKAAGKTDAALSTQKETIAQTQKAWEDLSKDIAKAFNFPDAQKPIEIPPPETSKFKEGLKELSSGFDFVTSLPDKVKTLATSISELFFEKKKVEVDTTDLDMAGAAVDDLEEKLTGLSETEITISPTITPTVDTTQVDQVPAKIAATFAAGTPTMVAPFTTVANGIIAEFNRITAIVDALIAKIATINLPKPQGSGAFGGEIGGGFAAGGLFSGKPGTDTNLAWLTHKEFVQPVNAVEKFGVNFMEMVRRLDVQGIVRWAQKFAIPGFASGGLVDWVNKITLPTNQHASGSIDWLNNFDIPKFNVGGLVRWMNDIRLPSVGNISHAMMANLSPVMIPAFAGGGLNESARRASSSGSFSAAMQQQFAGHFSVDLRTDKGTFRVMAPSNTAKELQRISASERLSSAGPPPNWVGRRGR